MLPSSMRDRAGAGALRRRAPRNEHGVFWCRFSGNAGRRPSRPPDGGRAFRSASGPSRARRKGVMAGIPIKHKPAAAGVVAAVMGGLLKLAEVAKVFPPPSDLIGNVVVFAAVLLIAHDIVRGGLYD